MIYFENVQTLMFLNMHMHTSSSFTEMIHASAGGSLMKMLVDNAYELYERVLENNAMQPFDKKTTKKTAELHNIVKYQL